MTVIHWITVALLASAAALAVLRLLTGRSLADKALAADVLGTVLAVAIVVGAALDDRSVYLPVALVIVLLGFIATVTVARFIEHKESAE